MFSFRIGLPKLSCRIHQTPYNAKRLFSDEPFKTTLNRPKIQRRSYQQPKKSSIGKWLLLGVPVATFCLGTWQVRRRTWKNELIERINKRTLAAPGSLPEDLESVNWKALEYKRFVVSGIFDHSKELYLQPRTFADQKDNSGGGGGLISSGPRVGVHVVTPFFIPEKGFSILINRGFVDQNRKKPETRQEGQVGGEVSITGMLRLTEGRKMMPKNDPEQNRWGYIDVEEMAQITGCEPILLDASLKSSVPGGPIGGQTRIRLWNQHFSYIITWYSLSAVTSLMWYSRYLR